MDQQMNRRELLTAAAAAACLCCLTGAGNLLADEPATSGPTTVDVGVLTDYPADGITGTWLKTANIAVIRHSGRLYACTSVCTHRGGILKTPDGLTFVCPRHHATFDIDGDVTKGPAKLPLNRFAISVGSDGHITVDKTRQFTPEQWDDPASFIKIS